MEEKKEFIPTTEFVLFTCHLPIEETLLLQIGDTIDHRDQVGRIKDKQSTRLKIHYIGWNKRWDCWSCAEKESHRFAKRNSISKRPNTRFPLAQIGDFIRFRPKYRLHHGRDWKFGKIRRFDEHSGQVQVVYSTEKNISANDDENNNISDNNNNNNNTNNSSNNNSNIKQWLYWTHMDNSEEVSGWFSSNGAAEKLQFHQSLCMREIYRNKNLDDVTFIIGSNRSKISAIRALIGGSSPVLYKLLYGNFLESKKETEVLLPSITTDAFRGIKLYSYHLPINLDALGIFETLLASRLYCIEGLRQFCESNLPIIISKKIDKACKLFSKIVNHYKDEKVKRWCLISLSKERLSKLFRCDEFYEWDLLTIIAYIEFINEKSNVNTHNNNNNNNNNNNSNNHLIFSNNNTSNNGNNNNSSNNLNEILWIISSFWSFGSDAKQYIEWKSKKNNWMQDISHLAERCDLQKFRPKIQPLLKFIDFSSMQAQFFKKNCRPFKIFTPEQIIAIQDNMLVPSEKVNIPEFDINLFDNNNNNFDDINNNVSNNNTTNTNNSNNNNNMIQDFEIMENNNSDDENSNNDIEINVNLTHSGMVSKVCLPSILNDSNKNIMNDNNLRQKLGDMVIEHFRNNNELENQNKLMNNLFEFMPKLSDNNNNFNRKRNFSQMNSDKNNKNNNKNSKNSNNNVVTGPPTKKRKTTE